MRMKKKCKRIILGVCFICMILSILFTLFDFKVFSRAVGNEFYFNILTLNSIIAGFSFTNIGLLLNTVNTEVVQKLVKTDIMKKKNDKLVASVIYCVSSMLISLPYVTDLGQIASVIIPISIIQLIADGLYLAIIILMIFGIGYFIGSIIDISNVLDHVYKNKSDLSPDKVEAIHEALRRKSN